MTPETAQLIRPREDLVRAFDGSWHATPNNVARSRRALLATLREGDVAEPVVDAIAAAVTEVTTNSVYHAFVGRRVGQFRISATIEPGEVKVSVQDDGCGFDGDAAVPAGHGLALAASVATRVETTSLPGSGTLTTLSFERTH